MEKKTSNFIGFVVMTILSIVIITISNFCIGCSLFETNDDSEDDSIKINAISFNTDTYTTKVGSMDYLPVHVSPITNQTQITLHWKFDPTYFECDTSSKFGITIKALKEGQSQIQCSYGGYTATCIVTVAGYEHGYEEVLEPYIYSNTNIIQIKPDVTEKVFVSLYGGDATDIDGYTWTLIDNSTVIDIEPTGQYCLITGKQQGYSRIKITHSKATYPYYIGVYVLTDLENTNYITTENNILTMNDNENEKTIKVSLVNGKKSSLNSAFNWNILTEDGVDATIRLSSNGENAIITPIKSGTCTIRVTHPDAPYPLDILCRVITIVKNVYIEPDKTTITLNGNDTATITNQLKNINESEYSKSDYQYNITGAPAAEIVSSSENQVMVRGIANGSCKLTISHNKAKYSREVLLIVTGQLTDAVDASFYITTTQNYIRTKVGAQPTELQINLQGGEPGDERNFLWSIKDTNMNGSTGNVIDIETTHGQSEHARMLQQTVAYGKCNIIPKAEGTAVITISHPKVAYPTDILVKVLNTNAILEEQLYFTGNGLVRTLNSTTYDYKVQLKGSSKTESDNHNIKWSIDDRRLTVTGNENIGTITAPTLGTGSTISNMTIHHDKAENDKKVIVMTADDIETLMNMKVLYSDKNYYNLEVGNEAIAYCQNAGFDKEDPDTGMITERYDFSRMAWHAENTTIIDVEKSENAPTNCKIIGLKAGSTKLIASITDTDDNGTQKTYQCEWQITIYPEGSIQTEPEPYFTTSQNVVTLTGKGDTKEIKVNPIYLPEYKQGDITWDIENYEDKISIIPNGTSAIITAKVNNGLAMIKIHHDDCQNELKIYIHIGNEYIEKPEDKIIYISSDDIITMQKDSQMQKLQAVLVNYEGDKNASGFSFALDEDGKNIAKIVSQTEDGYAFIKPLEAGQAQITITSTKTELEKKVLIIVANTAEELMSYKYLTTTNNVVTIGEGNTKTVNVNIKNTIDPIITGFNWESSDPNIVSVIASGVSATIHGNSIGTTIIKVTNDACKYPLEIIAQCVDPIAASESPYIQLSSSVITTNINNSTYTNITAELIGGNEEDNSLFTWTSHDPTTCTVYGQNEVGKLKAQKKGQTYITVRHPKAKETAQLLVVCDETKESDCYISVPSSVINMKPTDSIMTIQATLINGVETDKYAFKWNLDAYDIIDMQYSANVCSITPKQSGTTTITIHHEKAAFDQEIIVNVQEWTEFSFPNTNVTITNGDVKFLNMEVPASNLATYIEYTTDNPSICTITGTSKTAQIQAIKEGTTTVHAKLIAASSGKTQGTSDLMVYIKKRNVDAVYISTTSTIWTIGERKTQQLDAFLTGTGVTTTDGYNLKWYSSDSDVVQIAGKSVNGYYVGESIVITGLKKGEATITCSHEKASSNLQFLIIVEGAALKTITLNKTTIQLVKGSTTTAQLTATIANTTTGSNDYNKLAWEDGISGKEKEIFDGSTKIAEIRGNGKTVEIFPLDVGKGKLRVYLNDPNGQHDKTICAMCDITIIADNSLLVWNGTDAPATNISLTLTPNDHEVGTEFMYEIHPADAMISWSIAGQDCITIHDEGTLETKTINNVEYRYGKIKVYSLQLPKEESSESATIIGQAKANNKNMKVTIACSVGWTYDFSIQEINTKKTLINLQSDGDDITQEPVTLKYFVSPYNANIEITCVDDLNFDTYFSWRLAEQDKTTGTGKVIITPISETPRGKTLKIIATATNPDNRDAMIAQEEIPTIFRYKKHTPIITMQRIDGLYSTYDGQNVELADGEQIKLKIKTKEKNSVENKWNVDVRIDNNKEKIKNSFSDKYNELSFTHPNDYIDNVFRISKIIIPWTTTTRKNRKPTVRDFVWYVVFVKEDRGTQDKEDWDRNYGFILGSPGVRTWSCDDSQWCGKRFFPRNSGACVYNVDGCHHTHAFWSLPRFCKSIEERNKQYGWTVDDPNKRDPYLIDAYTTSFFNWSTSIKDYDSGKIDRLTLQEFNANDSAMYDFIDHTESYSEIDEEGKRNFYFSNSRFRNLAYFYCPGNHLTWELNGEASTYKNLCNGSQKHETLCYTHSGRDTETHVCPHVMTDFLPDVTWEEKAYDTPNDFVKEKIGEINIQNESNDVKPVTTILTLYYHKHSCNKDGVKGRVKCKTSEFLNGVTYPPPSYAISDLGREFFREKGLERYIDED